MIILVTWGHICAFSSGAGYDKNALTTYIRLFQMPVFVFISGYFQKEMKAGVVGMVKYLIRLFLSLGMPFCFFCLLAILSNRIVSAFLSDPVSFSLGSFWFFPCILICKVLATIILFVVKNKQLRYISFTVVAVFPFFVNIDLFYFSFLWLFYAVGVMFKIEGIDLVSIIKRYIDRDNKKFCICLSILTVAVLILGYVFPTEWTFYIKTNYLLSNGFSATLKTIAFVLYRYLVYGGASVWAICVLVLLENFLLKHFPNKPTGIYETGKKTMFIYGMHMVLLKFVYEPLVLFLSHGNGVIDNDFVRYYVFSVFITMVLIFLFLWISRLLSKIPVVQTIMLGELSAKLKKCLL